MQLYLIRHTQPNIPAGVCYGQTDLPLAPSFPEEAVAVRKQLPELTNSLVYSSPLQRCLQLAQFCHPGTILQDERLLEIAFGAWEGKTWSEIDPGNLNSWMADYIHTRPPGGESFLDVIARLRSFFSDLSRQKVEQAVIFTHAGIIRGTAHLLQQIALQEVFDGVKVSYGSVHSMTLPIPYS